MEAVVSRLAERMKEQPEAKTVRDSITGNWEVAFNAAGLKRVPSKFYQLKELRNRFAHAFGAGSMGQEQAAGRAMQDRETCVQRLRECFLELLPEMP